ncbi:unnamed protein product [Nippostrongylus brasiliensis]|uniref:C2H2-type domain-containing protein n=1 Tax=Nippostrongylus brasiliensis TaxID=27835 RepID=A0A0N4YE18_NIPBR|nr:unnamed protein product [Nippostrongylus brasiliensis]
MAPFYTKCVECGVGPIELDTLRVHLRDVHKWTEEQIEAEQTKLKEKGSVEQKMMSCDKCDRVFRLEHKLRAHRQKAHGGAPRLPGSYVVCSNCHKKCVDALELTAHWRKEHAGESMTSPPHRPVVKAQRASVDVKPSSSGSENATPIKRPRHNWVNDTRTHEEVLDEMEQRKLDRLRAKVMTERERRLNKVQKNENNIGREQLLAQDNGQRDATVGDVLATAKRLIASKKDGSSSEERTNDFRPMLYAIVGIESAEKMKKFVDLTANNSFDNVMFFDASLVNKMCCDNDSDIKQEKTSAMGSSSQMEVSGSEVFETVKKEKLESTDSMNDQEICILNILPSRDDLPTTSEEHSSGSETRAESRSRRSDDACADISSEIDWTSCLVCGVYQTSEEMRLSSLERSQNLMLFASLLAQNLMETDEAAAHIGKEAEDVCGEFPKNGLAEVPPSIKSDTLAYLRLYAVLLDSNYPGEPQGEAVLEADDATRFFCENLMRYYGKGGWQTRDASQNDLQTFEMAPFYAKCVECGIGPIELDTLRVHLRDVHKWTEEQIEAEQTKLKEKGSVEQKMMSCDKCDRVFRLEHKLRAHRQKAHGGAPRLPGSYVVCSNCHKKCVDALELTTHWRKEHAGESMTSPPHRPVVKAQRASVDVKPSSSGSENATPIKRPRHNWVNDTRTHEEVLDEMEQRKLDRLRARVMTERERRLNKVQKNENNIGREQLLAQDNGQVGIVVDFFFVRKGRDRKSELEYSKRCRCAAAFLRQWY